MLETVLAWLRKNRKESGALPSIRELAHRIGAAPLTVQRALRRLAQEGAVHAMDRKGYFWGPEPLGTHSNLSSQEERFTSRFLGDLQSGAYHPWKELPTPMALGELYGVSGRHVGRMLEPFSQRGLIVKRGRKFFPSRSGPKAPGTSVLVIVRCDERGEILLDTEREIDFIKSVRRELDEREMGMVRIGYSEKSGGRFLNASGQEVRLENLVQPILGAILSTWLLEDPVRLLQRLEKKAWPLSVWWEHSVETFPKHKFKAGLAGFNLSFGASAGTSVGMHLATLDKLEVAFISPFHGNDWSPARLRGLKESLAPYGGKVQAFVDPTVVSGWHLERKMGNASAMRRFVDAFLSRFLDDPFLSAIPTWVLVNDFTAAAMLHLLRRRKRAIPHLVGFDNTSVSERLGFDSFAFHTDGMVRQMLHHILHPKAQLFASEPLQEMMGRLVVRS
jgi:DNA-binding transcriptional ArsR family regulator